MERIYRTHIGYFLKLFKKRHRLLQLNKSQVFLLMLLLLLLSSKLPKNISNKSDSETLHPKPNKFPLITKHS